MGGLPPAFASSVLIRPVTVKLSITPRSLQLVEVGCKVWGLAASSRILRAQSVAQAERTRLVLGNEEAVAAVSADPAQAGGVAALSVRGNFMFDPATHRDFLGALLGTGIERQKVLPACLNMSESRTPP